MLGRYLAVAAILLSPFAVRADVDVPAAIQAIKAVGREGAGNEAASAGWKQLVSGGGVALFPTLKAFDGANPTAANWLRSAIDGIAQAEKKAGRKLPTEALIAFVQEAKNAPAARRIAFELIAAQDKTTANGLLESMVNDPSLELRRDAIAAEIEKLKPISAALTLKPAYEKLFAASRDPDQIEQLAKLVEKVEGKADITKHMGFITKWQIAGPFDSPMGAGFGTPYPPEKAIDLAAEFKGKTPEKFTWLPSETKQTYGIVDLNAVVGKYKHAVIYAFAVVDVEKETAVDFRAGSQNALQIFVNGKKIFEREEYHHGTKLDQHVGKGTLTAGKNQILVKICQNDQPDQWAQVFGFQLRVCDHFGGPVPMQIVTPTTNK